APPWRDRDPPTSPSACRAPTCHETPRTACTTPSGVGNDTRRSSTSSSATLPTLHADPLVSCPRLQDTFTQPRTHPDCNPTPGAPVVTAGRLAGSPIGWPSSSRGAQPDIGRVELLDRRDVHRVVHIAGALVPLQRAADLL